MRFIGITGGVGAGKTEILKYIGQHYKCEIYLADDIGHKVKEPGTEGYQALVELLGRDILRADGQIDKPSMAAKIFADPALLEKVNQIIHPAVKNIWLTGWRRRVPREMWNCFRRGSPSDRERFR